MAYLLNPAEIALAIGAKCAGSVASDNEAMLNILNLLLPRVEDAMNVASLTHGETTDTFDVDLPARGFTRNGITLRLSNGYVDATTVSITDPAGQPVLLYTLDARYGVIYLNYPQVLEGRYVVKYDAGFKAEALPENEDVEVFTDVPEWIKGLVVTLMVMWYRTSVIAPKVPEGFSFHDIVTPLRQEITLRVYERYMRPRADVLFPITSVRTDGMLT